MEEVVIEKLVIGGQGMATLKDGRKVFVWNALPGEKVTLHMLKSKKSYAEAIAEEIIEGSPHRLAPKEPEIYLGSSPWQIMDIAYENEQKISITKELFEREGLVDSVEFDGIFCGSKEWAYRNKMEYSFWADDNGLSLALYNRGSHRKIAVKGSALAMPQIDDAANSLVDQLNKLKIKGSMLKSLILRATQKGEVYAALFVKTENFPVLEFDEMLVSLKVYYSNPKSPASVPTKLLQNSGKEFMNDKVCGKQYEYDVLSFFQGNVEAYEAAITDMKKYSNSDRPLVDMYSGVGTIGLSLRQEGQEVTLVELDEFSVNMAEKNAQNSAEVVHASTEKSLEYITSDATIVFDPPRAGLHDKVTAKVLEALPKTILYLSCNPATQARDVKALQEKYKILYSRLYNFFPKTPHIESLIVLELR